jgi:hypothetical protein
VERSASLGEATDSCQAGTSEGTSTVGAAKSYVPACSGIIHMPDLTRLPETWVLESLADSTTK